LLAKQSSLAQAQARDQLHQPSLLILWTSHAASVRQRLACPRRDLVAANRATSLTPTAYYLRLALKDQPGVLAQVTDALGKSGVSIEQMHQNANGGPGATVLIVVTHETTRDALDEALTAFELAKTASRRRCRCGLNCLTSEVASSRE